MATTLANAEECVAHLIDESNRVHGGDGEWSYELTSEVANIGVEVRSSSKILRVNPSWLRFVVDSGDFKQCVADEIDAWYLIQDLTCVM